MPLISVTFFVSKLVTLSVVVVTEREHAFHVCHLLCVEVGDIERGDVVTTIKHPTHIRHINIQPISVTFFVSKLETSSTVRLLHLLNMLFMFVTFFVSKLETLSVVRLLQP